MAIQEFQPDAVVVDLSLAEGYSLGLIEDIRARQHPMPILVFTMFDDPHYAVRALRAGAQGYLCKQEPSERLVTSLRTILDGRYAVSPEVSKLFSESSHRPPRAISYLETQNSSAKHGF